jgi:F-type H+-transporting ATPase subunit a
MKYLFIAGAVALFLFGFIFLRGPVPQIVISAEKLFSIGPIEVTNTMFTGWVTVGLILIGVFIITRREWTLVPTGMQNFVEAIIEAFYNLVTGVAGETNGRRFFPIVATIFFFIAISNWFSLTPLFNTFGGFVEADHGVVANKTQIGSLDVAYIGFSGPGHLSTEVIEEDDPDHEQALEEARADGKIVGEAIPLFRGINTDLNTPLAIAIISFIAVEFWGITSLGFFTYGKKFINFGKFFRGLFSFNFQMMFDGGIDAFVGILELISELVRLVSFTFRLFGNMFAGEVVILMFTFMTPLLITLPFYGLELFVGVIQAFIFAMLTLVFAVMAITHHGDEEHAESHASIDHAAQEPAH